MRKTVLLIFTFILSFGCIAEKSELSINFKNKKQHVAGPSSVESAIVSSVQIINNQLVINGNGFTDVTKVKVDGTAFSENFSIESKTATKIIANSIRAFSFDVSKVFNVILSDANASATFPIDFSLCNATLNGKGFDCAAPVADKDVLSYDAVSGKWKPRAVSGLNYLGAFNASSNPATGPATQPAGAYYIISASGSIAGIPFTIGDWLVSNGSAWQKIDNSTAVLSVFGRNGTVTAQTGDYNLDMLGDISFPTAPVAGKVLKFDGTHWVAGDDLSGGGAGSVSTTEIADGAITDVKVTSVSTSKLTGTISSAQITDGTIVNADINAAAAIDYSKLNIPNTTIPYAKLNIADGDIPAAKISGLPVLSSILAATITDGDTTHAPTGEAVYEALQTKLGTNGGTLSVGTISGVPTPVNPSDVVNKAYVDTLATLFVTDDIAEGVNLYFTEARVLGTDLAGLNTGVNGPITAADTVLSAFGKMQYQVTDLKAKGQWDKTVNDISYSAGNVSIDKKLRLKSDNANYIEMFSPNGLASTYTLTLPGNDGNANQVLKTDGAGVLAWVDLTDTSVQAFAKSALPTCAAGEVLKSNGTTFSCITDNTGAGAFSGTANSAVITTAGGALGVSATTSTELGYVSGVTSAIQTQLNSKQAALGFTPVNKAGDTISSGTFNFAGATLRASDPVAATDVVNKQYFETFGQWTKNASDIYRSTGNVGVGTSTPATKLDVVGDISASANLITGSGKVVFDTTPASLTSSKFLGYAGNVFYLGTCSDATCSSTSTNFNYDTSTSKLGINATSTNMLNIGGNMSLGGSYSGVAAPVNGLIVEGYVGVGTTSPSHPVTAVNPSGSSIRVGRNASNDGGFLTSSGNDTFVLSAAADWNGTNFVARGTSSSQVYMNSGNIAFKADSVVTNGATFTPTTRLYIQASTGNVGVGTVTPQSKFDVNGAVRVGVDATACSGLNAGAMRFSTPNVEFCNGATWAAFGTSNAAVASSQITDGTIVDADVAAAANITATKLGTGAVDNTEFNYLNGVTSSIQTQLNAKQATDATLTALATYNTNGILVQTAADTFVGRSIAGTANRLTVTNGDGVSGNPTLNIPTALLPSPVVGDVGKFLKATAADTSVWTALGSSDVTTALGFTPINKAGDSITTGTITLSGSAFLRVPDPTALTDVANKQYVDSFGQWTKSGSDIYRSTGRVGIGTATPEGMLQIGGDTSTGDIILKAGTAASGDAGDIIFKTNSGSQIGRVWTDTITGGLNLTGRTSNTSDLFLTPAGNVGIGTIVPTEKLEVNGTSKISGVAFKRYSWSPLADTTNTFLFKTVPMSNGNNAIIELKVIEGDNRITRTINIEVRNATGVNQVKVTPLIGSAGDLGLDLKYANANSNTGITEFYLYKSVARMWTQSVIVSGSSISFDTTGLDPAALTSVSLNTGLQISSTGLVGIGTTAPASKLHVSGGRLQIDSTASNWFHIGADTTGSSFGTFLKGGTATPVGYIGSDGGGITGTGVGNHFGIRAESDLILMAGAGEKMRLTAGGGLGIGTSTPGSSLHIANAAPYITFEETDVAQKFFTGVDGTGYFIRQGTTANGDIFTVKNTGLIGIGITTPSYNLHVNGSVAGTGAYNSLSDARLKKDIKTIPNSLEKISAIRGVSFNWDKEAHPELKLNDRGELGVIAQEVQKVFPNAVTVDKKTGILSVAYSMLIAPLIEAVKSLNKMVTEIFSVSHKNSREIASVKAENALKDQKIKKLEQENLEMKARLDKIEKMLK